MNRVMPWIKANVPTVVLSALIVLILPAAFVGSSWWNGKIRRNRQMAVDKATGDLKALQISYALPSPTPGGTPTLWPSEAPNATANQFFKENRQKLEQQVAEVANVARDLNRDGHTLLVEGLFIAPTAPGEGAAGATGASGATGATAAATPVPPGTPPPAPTSVDSLKAIELIDVVVGRSGKKSVYDQLLENIHAGAPADPLKVDAALRDIQDQFVESVKAQSNRDKLTDDEQKQLTDKLVQTRIGQYQAHAKVVSVYATRDNLPSSIPRTAPSDTPDALTCFNWNFDYWVTDDLLKAIAAANTRDGKLVGVDQSVVKRIEKIQLDPPGGPADASITGRKEPPDNKLYDVRDATLKLVVSSTRLPELFDAIAKTNFMTVIGLEVGSIDPWAELEQGYYYGSEPVSRVTVRVETIWLRSWTEPLMPQAFRDLVAGTPADQSAGASAPPPPPSAPMTSRGRGAEESPSPARSRRTQPKKGRGGG